MLPVDLGTIESPSPSWWRRHWERTGIMDVDVADTMPGGWQRWLDWHRVIGPDNELEISALEADRGSFLGYVRRRVAAAVKQIWRITLYPCRLSTRKSRCSEGRNSNVAIGIGKEHLPRGITNLRLAQRVDNARLGLPVYRKRIAALIVAGDAGGSHLLAPGIGRFLKHESGASKRHPAPAQAAVGDPGLRQVSTSSSTTSQVPRGRNSSRSRLNVTRMASTGRERMGR